MAAIFWHDGKWHEGEQPKILGPLDHAMWMASVAFDGARAFDGCAPDLDLHCARLIDSSRKMLLEPTMTADEITVLCREAVRRLPRDSATYIRPMYYAMTGFVTPEPSSTPSASRFTPRRCPSPRG